jgi:hypothetical protein
MKGFILLFVILLIISIQFLDPSPPVLTTVARLVYAREGVELF